MYINFSYLIAILGAELRRACGDGQLDVLFKIFATFLNATTQDGFALDDGLVSRWWNGKAQISPKIRGFYEDKTNQMALVQDILNVLTFFSDPWAICRKIVEDIKADPSISEEKKELLLEGVTLESHADCAEFLATVLCFAMSCPVQKNTVKKCEPKTVEPRPAGRIYGSAIPKPSPHFVGRQEELETLHTLVHEHDMVYVEGLAGIGKSELIYAYGQAHKTDYAHQIYIPYSGDLMADIASLNFGDVSYGDDRFEGNHRQMQQFGADTLLVIDQFNVTPESDEGFALLAQYECKVIMLTRCHITDAPVLVVTELPHDTLFQLMVHLYPNAEANQTTVERIIKLVHGHTLAVELVARLLSRGQIAPSDLLGTMKLKKLAYDIKQKIRIHKDGRPQNECYYHHIRTLFALYHRSPEEQAVLRNLTLMPTAGVPCSLFTELTEVGDWNAVDTLIDLGYVQNCEGQFLTLKPMICEVALSELSPSVVSCRTLLENIRGLCLCHGEDLEHPEAMAQMLHRISKLAEKDDDRYYLRFMEDVYFMAHKYGFHREQGDTLRAVRGLVSLGDIGDQALLLEMQGAIATTEEGIILGEKALNLLSNSPLDSPRIAHLTVNIHSNLATRYIAVGKPQVARYHLEQAFQIFCEHADETMYTMTPLVRNYAVFLCDSGEHEQSLTALRQLCHKLEDADLDDSYEYGLTQQTMGDVLITQTVANPQANLLAQAIHHYSTAIRIYQSVLPRKQAEQKIAEMLCVRVEPKLTVSAD